MKIIQVSIASFVKTGFSNCPSVTKDIRSDFYIQQLASDIASEFYLAKKVFKLCIESVVSILSNGAFKWYN